MLSQHRAEKLARSFANHKLGIIFVGMSNVGKSYQTKKLTENPSKFSPFARICVDDEIEEELSRQLRKDGIEGKGIEAVAQWMGSPHSDDSLISRRYQQREKTYLALENASYQRLASTSFDGSWTVDTTGSFVHCRPAVQRELADKGLVVYIEATQADMDDMLKSYVAKPKPVCWAGYYTHNNGETTERAIERSYQNLLLARARGYNKIADVAIAKHDVRQTKDANELLELIKSRLS
jgi:shikimate kinase